MMRNLNELYQNIRHIFNVEYINNFEESKLEGYQGSYRNDQNEKQCFGNFCFIKGNCEKCGIDQALDLMR